MRRTDARVTGRILSFVAMALASVAMVGCAGTTPIDGRVVRGPVGLAVVVDAGDERLSEPGVPGVEVAIYRENGASSGPLITSATTDPEGNFAMVLARGQHPGGPVIVRVRGEGIFTTRARSYLPRAGQKLLCTVIGQPEPASP